MTITTKFSIDGTVYKFYNNKIEPFVVESIRTTTNSHNQSVIEYGLRGIDQFWINEKDCFSSREELIKSL